jgi:hypothetical protein
MATNKLKTFLFKHIEKVLLGLALAGLAYVIAYNLTRASVGDIVQDLNDQAATVTARIENPAEPPVPGPPPPPPLAGDLRPPEAALAPSNPFALRIVGDTAPGPEVVVVAVGVAPPAGVSLAAVPGANIVEWWRAPGQGSDVRVDIFKTEKDRFPGPVPETIGRDAVADAALGFAQVALNVEAAEDGHGVYQDTYIVGEVHYLYAVSSVRVSVQETASAGSVDAYWNEFESYEREGISFEEIVQMMGPPPKGSGESTQKITAQEWGYLFRTAQVVTAIPLVFELRSVTVDKEAGDPVGRVYVKRLHLGQWYGTFFTVRKGDQIGGSHETSVKGPDGRRSRQPIDLNSKATVLGFEQFEEEIVVGTFKGQERRRTVKSWKMQYTDKDGNVLEMVKKSGR